MNPHFRQGDVLVERVAMLPAEATLLPHTAGSCVLAHGARTGHHHVVRDAGASLFATERTLFLVMKENAAVQHEEHAPLWLEPGTYRVTLQREYVPASANIRPEQQVGSTSRRIRD